MNIMYLCDDNYIWIAGISILSLLKNNAEADEINIYVVVDNVSKDNMNKLQSLVFSFERNVWFIQKPDIRGFIGIEIELHWWIENVFSRVFLERVFADYNEIHRLIYIDCDTLVTGSLLELWGYDLNGAVGAGVLEPMGECHKRVIHLKKEDNYFNAGMFLIDLDVWKKEKIDEKAKEFIINKKGRLEYADESVLNGVLSRKMRVLHPKYNLTSLSVYFNSEEVMKYRKPYRCYSEKEREEGIRDARIVHFTSTYVDNRPWTEHCNHPWREEWLVLKEESPWKDYKLQQDNRSYKKRIARHIAILLPRRVRILFTGFIHAYLKPLKYCIYN